MPEIVTVLLLALLPGLGNFAGGLVAEALPRSDVWLNRALHAAAGVVMAVVAVEIFPGALKVASGWVLGVAFGVGGLLYLAADAAVERRAAEGRGRMWMIYLAVAADLFGDGLLIGAGSAVSAGLGLVLAIGQVLADLPEGFAAMSTLRSNDVPRSRRLLLSASFLLPVLVAAVLSFLLLRNRPENWKYIALVGTAGLFTVAAFEDMITEAHEAIDESRYSSLALIAGFVLFVFVSAGLG
jgi:ZIP family zinc transporter